MRFFYAMCVMVVASVYAENSFVLVVNNGTVKDGSFFESAYRGAERFKQETGNDYAIVLNPKGEPSFDELPGMIEKAAKKAKRIMLVGFEWWILHNQYAWSSLFPDHEFVLIDYAQEAKNVRNILFQEQEGSYLVGVLAALQSKTKQVGFVGGMPIPIIFTFLRGYEMGVKSVDKNMNVLSMFVGNTPNAWNDPQKAKQIAETMIQSGTDVIFAAAGASSLGVHQACAERATTYSIGVDINQNGLFPGSVLTSMLKRVDRVVYDEAKRTQFKSGVYFMGVKKGYVGWAIDENNQDMIVPSMYERVFNAQQDIKNGSVKVMRSTK